MIPFLPESKQPVHAALLNSIRNSIPSRVHQPPSIDTFKLLNINLQGISVDNLNKGWTIPTDAETAAGKNPGYSILPGDSEACIKAKKEFNFWVDKAWDPNPCIPGAEYAVNAILAGTRIHQSMIEVNSSCK